MDKKMKEGSGKSLRMKEDLRNLFQNSSTYSGSCSASESHYQLKLPLLILLLLQKYFLRHNIFALTPSYGLNGFPKTDNINWKRNYKTNALTL